MPTLGGGLWAMYPIPLGGVALSSADRALRRLLDGSGQVPRSFDSLSEDISRDSNWDE